RAARMASCPPLERPAPRGQTLTRYATVGAHPTSEPLTNDIRGYDQLFGGEWMRLSVGHQPSRRMLGSCGITYSVRARFASHTAISLGAAGCAHRDRCVFGRRESHSDDRSANRHAVAAAPESEGVPYVHPAPHP